MTTTSPRVRGGYSGSWLAVHPERPTEIGVPDSQVERYAAAAVAPFPRRAVVVEHLANVLVRSRTLVVDGYVRSAPPRAWNASLAAIDRGLIRRWAARCGWRVGRVFEEPTSVGLTDRRSLLLEAVTRVESRESDGLVVARLKNLGNSLEEAVAVLERIQAAGGAFVSVCDGIDLAGSNGRMLLRVLVSVLEW